MVDNSDIKREIDILRSDLKDNFNDLKDQVKEYHVDVKELRAEHYNCQKHLTNRITILETNAKGSTRMFFMVMGAILSGIAGYIKSLIT